MTNKDKEIIIEIRIQERVSAQKLVRQRVKNNVSQTHKLWLSYTIGQFNMSAYCVSSNSVMGFKSGEAVRETKSKVDEELS